MLCGYRECSETCNVYLRTTGLVQIVFYIQSNNNIIKMISLSSNTE